MSEGNKYNRGEMRKKLRNMLLNMGFDVPEKIEPHEALVCDKDGNVVDRFWIGDKPTEKENGKHHIHR